MSMEFESQLDELQTYPIFPSGSSIKVVRFTVGTTTVELHSSGEDENCPGTSNALNIVLNPAGSTSMVLRASPSQSQGPPSQLPLASQRNSTNSPQTQRAGSRTEEANQKKKEEDEYTNRMNGWFMTVATLLMNMAFTAGLNIPGGAWSSSQFNSPTISNTQTTPISSYDPRHIAGQPIIMNLDRYRYYVLMFFDVIAFGCSMSIVILLLFKKSPKHGLLRVKSLLVYALVLVAIVYVLGCTPYSLFIGYIFGVGLFFTFLHLAFGWILWPGLKKLWGRLKKLWGWLTNLWDKLDAFGGRLRAWILCGSDNSSGDGRQQASAESIISVDNVN